MQVAATVVVLGALVAVTVPTGVDWYAWRKLDDTGVADRADAAAIPVALLATVVDVDPFLLVFAYAVATVAAGFGLTKAARRLAHALATDAALTADEHGAVLADDPDALACALRKRLDALDDTPDARTEPARRESTTANTSS